ncbi:MAG TPA: ABC transporter permease [Candidatus Dormibacteraeota bacterium]|nr:ABC transporter permease [Candidatus Dormibacteraeota bacterium]
MTFYILRRILISIPVLIGVTLITFLLLHATAGSFVPGLEINPNLRPEDVARIRHSLGLDQPLYLQYIQWLAGLVHGDFGRSLIDGSPVLSHILERLPNTLELTFTAMLIGLLVSIPLGVIGAIRRGSKDDNFLTVLSVAGVSIPGFWLGLMLILFFSVEFHDWGLPFLPSSGATSPLGAGDLTDRLEHLIMPATVLSFGYIAIWSRYTRSSMLEVLSQDYVRTARAKGMTERRLLYVHALRNAMVPLVTLVGLELPGLVSGGAIVEIVFSWPGIGRLALERALQYDYTMVLGLTTFAAILVVAGNLIADILYAVLDPRIKYR